MNTQLRDGHVIRLDEKEELVVITNQDGEEIHLTLQAALGLLDWLRESEYRIDALIDNREGL